MSQQFIGTVVPAKELRSHISRRGQLSDEVGQLADHLHWTWSFVDFPKWSKKIDNIDTRGDQEIQKVSKSLIDL